MNLVLDCARCQDLLSDHLEESLEPGLAAAMDDHLARCPECAALREAMAEVMSALRAYPVLEAPRGLAERAAAAALRAGRVAGKPLRATLAAVKPATPPAWLQIAAAGLAALVTAGVLYATRSETPARAATRFIDRTQNAGTYLLERKDRLVEDVRLLRVVITTAFEGRLDRMNDRVDDYKRLLEKRRLHEEQQKKNRGSAAVGGSSLRAEGKAAAFRTGAGDAA
jgi:anti-sigma factor RsiW